MNKEKVIYLYNGTLLGHKKIEILLFIVTWMEMENIIVNKTSQAQKDKYHMFLLILETRKLML
jgi:hypothetical protein